MSATRRAKKPRGLPIDCPCCNGTGVQRVLTFKQLEDLLSWKDGQLRGTIALNGKKFKVYLHLEEVEA